MEPPSGRDSESGGRQPHCWLALGSREVDSHLQNEGGCSRAEYPKLPSTELSPQECLREKGSTMGVGPEKCHSVPFLEIPNTC